MKSLKINPKYGQNHKYRSMDNVHIKKSIHYWKRYVRKEFLNENPNCSYCGKLLFFKNSTLDHIIPVSKGGVELDLSNLTLYCNKCNSFKDNRIPEEAGMELKYKHKWM
jgi:5-methylcytosine-specific restriction endonuclease McrA